MFTLPLHMIIINSNFRKKEKYLMDEKYLIKMFNDGKQMKFKGTVSYLTEYFDETIKKGKKHESEEGHVFVNESPNNIKLTRATPMLWVLPMFLIRWKTRLQLTLLTPKINTGKENRPCAVPAPLSGSSAAKTCW